VSVGAFLQGESINVALDEDDIEVRVGDGVCDVTSMSSTQLTCLPAQLYSTSTPPPLSTVLVSSSPFTTSCSQQHNQYHETS